MKPHGLKLFFANRVSFIREASEPSQWKYVGTALNPADMASRGIKEVGSFSFKKRKLDKISRIHFQTQE